MATFAERVRQLRKESNLNQSQLAEEIGVTFATISIWERGKRLPEFTTMEKLCDYFNVSIAYLLGTTDERKPNAEADAEINYPRGVHDSLVISMQRYAQLSDESKMLVESLIDKLYESDKYQGLLQEPADGLKEELENLIHLDLLR